LIHEVHYDDEGHPHGYGATPAVVGGDSLEEIESQIRKMQECLVKSVLDVEMWPAELPPLQPD
jgi:hypothetical protein